MKLQFSIASKHGAIAQKELKYNVTVRRLLINLVVVVVHKSEIGQVDSGRCRGAGVIRLKYPVDCAVINNRTSGSSGLTVYDYADLSRIREEQNASPVVVTVAGIPGATLRREAPTSPVVH